ncbi:MAG TPA: hypothetical protein VK524_30035 [Polyangiaceae bacterium]|nr:hypothetical protein [Polyangiaceae bacterium]
MTRIPSDPALSPEGELDHELVTLLRAAWSPDDLDEALNRTLIELALEDPLAEPSADELVESDRLRRALDGEIDHPNLALLAALRAAVKPGDPPAALTSSLQEPAAKGSNVIALRRAPGSRARGVYAVVGAAAALAALAASALLFVLPAEKRAAPLAASSAAPAPLPELRVTRSTQELFSEKFAAGETSARVDRIAEVRARELRSNRYALWGVR